MVDETQSDKYLRELGKRFANSQELLQSTSLKSGYGPISSGVTATFGGHNHRGMGNPAPVNNEQYGMVFFTRPRLNLSYDNIIRERSFTPMLSTVTSSIPRAIRSILDPKGERIGSAMRNGKPYAPAGYITSPLTDPYNAFISILSNNLETMNGWPDPYVDTYTSRAGIQKEEYSMVDSTAKMYQAYDLTCNFRNIVGDPVGYMFHVWTQYASLVREGTFDPHPEMLLENEIDYNTRIYRLILDPSRTYVLRIGACGAAFPTSNSIGSTFNFATDKPFNRDSDQLSITFRAMGAMYYDPILIRQFNRTVMMFNPAMFTTAAKDRKSANDDNGDDLRKSTMVKLNAVEKPLFNYQGYPRINPYTSELEWWVPKSDYEAIYNTVKLTN